jgi:diguanylate cyclase (GGDEF)-like protein
MTAQNDRRLFKRRASLVACLITVFTNPAMAAITGGGMAHPVFLQWVPYVLVAALSVIVGFLVVRISSLLNRLEREVAERTADLSEANKELTQAARIDPLTGVLNRRGFEVEAEAESKRFFRNDRSFALVMADIDNFKDFNDSHGHACGDGVLNRIASTLSSHVREVDRVARWGGEEFILLLPETDQEGAVILAEKLRERIADERFMVDGEGLIVTMTFGIAVHRKGESLATTIARADTALYHGKQRGRNKVMIGNYKGLTLVR